MKEQGEEGGEQKNKGMINMRKGGEKGREAGKEDWTNNSEAVDIGRNSKLKNR